MPASKGKPAWMTALDGVLSALVNGANAIASYEAAKILEQKIGNGGFIDDTISNARLTAEVYKGYIALYLIVAPMLQQAVRFKENVLKGLPDPAEDDLILEELPKHYRTLSTLVFQKNVISIKLLSRLGDEADELEEDED